MLYSPLYQSIRLILFGALGLSSLTVSAALNDVNTSQTELPITDNSATHSPDNSDFADSRLDTTNLNDNSLNSSALNNSDLNSNTLDSNALDITDIEEN
ncbi:MAG: hypothetical protein J6N72_08715, partial [Psychrobacter sp.]|nr:hypothetical protein [Psychrobacter sp.]